MVVLFLLVLSQSPSCGLSLDDCARIRSVQDVRSSPDGKSMVLQIGTVDTVADGHTSDPWSVDLDSGALRRLTNHPATDYSARFSSDGRTLGFLTTRRGPAEAFGLPLEGGGARPGIEAKLAIFPEESHDFSNRAGAYPDRIRLIMDWFDAHRR